MDTDEIECSFCGHPNAIHEGGMELDDHILSGFFCGRKCFDLWVKWKTAFINWQSQKKEMNNNAES